MFTIYGAFLQHSGAGKFFIDFSMALTGGKPNSAGRTVVLSSFLLGGPSGSGVATTVTIGAVAYPMMKHAGFEKNAAGGLLAAGGLGAILSPPVLGAAAFLIAEFLKISYLDVIWMATIPTCLYYLSLLFMVELDAKRFGSSAVTYEQSMSLGALLKRYGFHFTSLIAVIVFMIAGFSPMLAVFYCVLMCFLLSAITPETSLGPRRLLLPLLVVSAVILTPPLIDVLTPLVNALLRIQIPLVAWPGMTDLVGYYLPALILVLLGGLAILGLMNVGNEEVLRTKKLTRTLSDGSIGVLSAATTCASAGIIVGVVTLTGLGLKFSSIVLDYAGGSLLLTAIYTALVVWIVGLAVPVTASYIICAVIAAPALTKLGVPDYAAHMFIFYYAVLSEVSPPTALSPFAAAAITGGDPVQHHDAGLEIHAAGVPGAVRVRARPAGRRPADENSQGRLGLGHRADHGEDRGRPRRARGSGAELGAATEHHGRAGAVGACGPSAGVPESARGAGGADVRLRCAASGAARAGDRRRVVAKTIHVARPSTGGGQRINRQGRNDRVPANHVHMRYRIRRGASGRRGARAAEDDRDRDRRHRRRLLSARRRTREPDLEEHAGLSGDRRGDRRLGRQSQADRLRPERARLLDGGRRARCRQRRRQVQGRQGRACAP